MWIIDENPGGLPQLPFMPSLERGKFTEVDKANIMGGGFVAPSEEESDPDVQMLRRSSRGG